MYFFVILYEINKGKYKDHENPIDRFNNIGTINNKSFRTEQFVLNLRTWIKTKTMKLLNNKSLIQTVDNVSEALFFGLDISNDEKNEIANFIINQQGKPNTYANTFAPTEIDLKQDLILFTGDKIKSRVGKCHVIGEEASRVLRKLNLQNNKVDIALKKANEGLFNKVNMHLKNQRYEYGMYCCKSCSCGLWINLTSGGITNDTKMLKAGLEYLKKHRDNKGRWTGFPYYYTLYVLNEIEKDIVIEELRYSAKLLERRVKKKRMEENNYVMRRNYIREQILDKVNSN
jgi:hypothetical protein